MSNKSVFNFGRLYKAFLYSIDGLKCCFKEECAFRQEVCACLLLVPLSLFLGKDLVSKLLLIGSLCLVLIVELLNSALENVVNLISPDYHLLAKKAKDMASAAVLFSLIVCVLTWCIVLASTFF